MDLSDYSTFLSAFGGSGVLNPIPTPQSAFGNPFAWTAQRYDPLGLDADGHPTGLYQFLYRSYSPTLGRWLQRDPLEYVDSASLYTYVGSNPLDQVDPLGLAPYPITPLLPRQSGQGAGGGGRALSAGSASGGGAGELSGGGAIAAARQALAQAFKAARAQPTPQNLQRVAQAITKLRDTLETLGMSREQAIRYVAKFWEMLGRLVPRLPWPPPPPPFPPFPPPPGDEPPGQPPKPEPCPDDGKYPDIKPDIIPEKGRRERPPNVQPIPIKPVEPIDPRLPGPFYPRDPVEPSDPGWYPRPRYLPKPDDWPPWYYNDFGRGVPWVDEWL